MRRTYRRPKPKISKKFKANRQIKSPEVFLIDFEGEKIGNINTEKAILIAQEAGLDLVEVNPKADPPICKIMDYGQFKYEQSKKAQKQQAKNKKAETKNIRLSVRIGAHDLKVRLNQAKKFMDKGHKVRLELRLKGRERQHPQTAKDIINQFVEKMQEFEDLNVVVEEPLTKQGGKFNILLANKK